MPASQPEARGADVRGGPPTDTGSQQLDRRRTTPDEAPEVAEHDQTENGVILEVRDLTVTLSSGGGKRRPVDGVSFRLYPGKTMCLVGESGSGKSLTALSIMRLSELEIELTTEGQVVFNGLSILDSPQSTVRSLRGREIALVPQEPLTALNPLLAIGRQLEHVGTYHAGQHWESRRRVRREFHGRAVEALRAVGLADAEQVMSRYPHELSGGMRQRVMIAMALIAEPALIIADEPTTALDVTTQAQILSLLADLQRRTGAAVILITHNLAVAAQVADSIAVMYAGNIVERGPAETVFAQPAHPYTVGLIESIPTLDGPVLTRLPAIPGSIPQLGEWHPGCKFTPRCSRSLPQCANVTPPLEAVPGEGHGAHYVACWNPTSGATE